VLVVEYGEVAYAPGAFDPPSLVWGGATQKAGYFSFNSLPNPEMNGKQALVFVGQVNGGSSAINGMYFDRGSRHDYDAWAQIGDPEYANSTIKWDWENLYPYFKKVSAMGARLRHRTNRMKSVTFTPPIPSVVEQYGFTWDMSVYGGTTPIHSSFPSFQWGDTHVARKAWTDMGIRIQQECADGDKEGLCWIPISQHPVTARRSHAGLGHYSDIAGNRSNYDLLVRHQVIRVVYTDGISQGPPRVEMRSLSNDEVFNVTAEAEVIVSAGAIHTPTILQRSGIGPVAFLNDMNITVVLDLPGVGSNLQDHSSPGVSWNCEYSGCSLMEKHQSLTF
jgi:choline dehydrogenase